MSPPDNQEQQLLQQLQGLYASASTQAAEGTGDASLDMLLLTAEPAFAQLIQDLAVPHWFDEQVIAALSPGPDLASPTPLLEKVIALPFIRHHPRGYAYHDVVRQALRRFLSQKSPGRLAELSRRLVEMFRPKEPENEEVRWEVAYLTLAADEQTGLTAWETIFREARRQRRYAVCETLVHMAGEQQESLTPQGNSLIDYCRGVLALDLHHLDQAEAIFKDLSPRELPAFLEARVRIHLGITKEAQGLWPQAEKVYRDSLQWAGNESDDPDFRAKLHQRLAETYLAQGDLYQAEKHAHASCKINQENANRLGEALNFETLGRIYDRLRDLEYAEQAFARSLAILDKLGREFDKAKIYNDLASLYFSFGRWQEAEQHYQQAQEIKLKAGDNYGLAGVFSNLGKVYLRKGNTDGALEAFHNSLGMFQGFGDRLNSARILRNIAITHEQLNDIPSALDYMEQAVKGLPEGSPIKKSYLKETRRLMEIETAHLPHHSF